MFLYREFQSLFNHVINVIKKNIIQPHIYSFEVVCVKMYKKINSTSKVKFIY